MDWDFGKGRLCVIIFVDLGVKLKDFGKYGRKIWYIGKEIKIENKKSLNWNGYVSEQVYLVCY